MSRRDRTPEEVADICQRVLDDVPAEELVGASIEAILTLTSHGLYPEAAALCRRSKGVMERRIYDLLMQQAQVHGHDQALVFAAVYGYDRNQ